LVQRDIRDGVGLYFVNPAFLHPVADKILSKQMPNKQCIEY